MHVVVEAGHEEGAAEHVAQHGRDDALPDVQADGETGGAEEDAEGDEEHVGDHVLEAADDKDEDGPPHGRHLARDVLGQDAEVAGQADEPVAADAAEEDLVPLGLELLVGDEGDGGLLVELVVEDAAVCEERRGLVSIVGRGEVFSQG